MANKQTRRSISISGSTYWRLKAYCQEKGCSMSSLTETLILGELPEGSPEATQETKKVEETTPPPVEVEIPEPVMVPANRVETIRRVVERRPAEETETAESIFTF